MLERLFLLAVGSLIASDIFDRRHVTNYTST